MNKRVINIIVAIVMGLTAVGIYIISQKREESPPVSGTEEELIPVVVARTKIPRNTLIKASHLAHRKLPKNAIEPNAIFNPQRAIGKISAIDITSGEQMTTSKLLSRQRVSSLSMRTPIGKRAITIPIDRFSSFEGLIKPGDYVDIIGIFKIPQKVEGQTVTQNITLPLFQNVLVLAVGSSFKEETVPGASTVTLALLPQEAQLLTFAVEQGQIRLVLRSPLDSEKKPLPPVSMDTLWQILFQSMGRPQQPQPPPEEKEPPIEIYRGGKK